MLPFWTQRKTTVESFVVNLTKKKKNIQATYLADLLHSEYETDWAKTFRWHFNWINFIIVQSGIAISLLTIAHAGTIGTSLVIQFLWAPWWPFAWNFHSARVLSKAKLVRRSRSFRARLWLMLKNLCAVLGASQCGNLLTKHFTHTVWHNIEHVIRIRYIVLSRCIHYILADHPGSGSGSIYVLPLLLSEERRYSNTYIL